MEKITIEEKRNTFT